MICAQAVKPEQILWKPREKPSHTEPPCATSRFCKPLVVLLFLVHPRESVANPRRKKFSQIKMRPGPATPAASSVKLPTRLIRHSRSGMMLLARQRSRGSAAFAKAGCTRDLATTMRNRCGGRQPIPTHERDRGGGRNARATSSRSHAFPICPPAIHPRESPAAAGPAAIIRQAQKTLTFSLYPISARIPPPAIRKQPTLVRKLWTKCLPCGNPRKTENDSTIQDYLSVFADRYCVARD
jgi:hypothetical protein